jgi:hypothetical protein
MAPGRKEAPGDAPVNDHACVRVPRAQDAISAKKEKKE